MSSQLSAGTIAIPPAQADRAPLSTSPDVPPPEMPRTFARQALADTFSRTGARVGLAWVIILAFCGVFAPFIASSHPVLVKMDGRWSSPLLRHLTPADVVLLLTTAAFGYAALFMRRRR